MSTESETDDINGEMKSLVNFALQNGLKESTVSILWSCGYDSIDTISAIIEEDIQQLDISMGQKSLLRRWVNALRQNQLETTSVSFEGPANSNTRIDRHTAKSQTGDLVDSSSNYISEGNIMDEHLFNLSSAGENNDSGDLSEPTKSISEHSSLPEQTQIPHSKQNHPEVVIVEGKKRYRPQIQIDEDDSSDEEGHENRSNPPVLKRLLKMDDYGALQKRRWSDMDLSDDVTLSCTDISTIDERQHDDTLAKAPQQSLKFGKTTVVSNTSNCVIADKLTVIKNEAAESRPFNAIDNVAIQTKKIIKNHRKEIFLVTNAFQNVLLILDDMHFVTISGIPGAGKTELALHILDLKSKDGFEPFILNSPEMWNNIVCPNRKQIILVDDIFGSYTFNSKKANEWLEEIEDIGKLIRESKGKILVVFTTRNYILRDIHHKLDKGNIFKAHCIADLSDNENALTVLEKKEMLKLYKEKYDFLISDEEIEDICDLGCTYGFPHSIKLFSSATTIREEGISFFQNPIQSLYRLIKCFEKEDKPKYCAFVMTSWADSFRISTLDDGRERNEILKLMLRLSGLPDNYPFKEIITAFQNLDGIYLQSDDGDEFKFNHETLKETTSYTVAETQPRIAIEEFDFDFIVARIRTAACKEQFLGKFYNIIPKFHYKNLAERILKEYKNDSDNLDIIMSHQCWDDTHFIEVFEGALSQNREMSHFISFLQCVGTFQLPAIFWAIWHKKDEVIRIADKRIMKMSFDNEMLFDKDTLTDTLIAASYKGVSCKILEMVIHLGADVNAKMTFCSHYDSDVDDDFVYTEQIITDVFDEKFGYHILNNQLTPIRASIIGHQTATFRCLLKHGGRLDESNTNSTSVMHIASEENQIDILSYMTEFMKNIPGRNLIDEKGRTPVHLAKSAEAIEILDKYDKFMLLKTDIGGNTALHYWARQGILKRRNILTMDTVKWVCQNKRGILNKRNLNGQTVLHCLVKSEADDFDVARFIEHLVTYGADVNAISNRGRTALHSAARTKTQRERTASVLIKYGIKINQPDINGNTALYYALTMSNGVINALIKFGADANIRNDKGLSLLHRCFLNVFIEKKRMGDKSFQYDDIYDYEPQCSVDEVIKILLTNFDSVVNQQTATGDTVLHISVRESVKYLDNLLKHGADPNIKNEDGITATMIAACKNINIFRKIVDRGGNMGLTDNKGQSILHIVLNKSTEGNILKVMQFLQEKGQEMEKKDENGVTPLMLAFRRGSKVIGTLLLEQGYNVKDLSSNGESIFHYIFKNSSMTLQKCMNLLNLIEFTANDINLKNKQGVTPLMMLCRNCPSADLILFLMSKGCVCQIRDNRQYTILHYLIMSERNESNILDLIQKLISASKDDILPLCVDFSLLCVALEKKYNTIVEFIVYKLLNAEWDLLEKILLKVVTSKLSSCSMQKILEAMYEKTKRSEIFDVAVSSGFANHRDDTYLQWILQKGARLSLFCGNEEESFVFGLIDSDIDDTKLNQIFSILFQHKAVLTILDKNGRNIFADYIVLKCKTDKNGKS